MNNFFEKKSKNEVYSEKLKAYPNDESQLGKIREKEKEIKNIEQEILAYQKSICALYGNSPSAINKIQELQKKKDLLEVLKDDIKWLIKNN